ncbi:MAG: pilus assembly protein HicB [Proteobacteria bacterium]|nr:pilus assembly protein HicB [Pseudomonadota bacterium]MBS0461729.1 pilus assembly protein HicB [Pseudomonadota bacterium]MBS0463652.1 pilus assembly protein HicB [Pseudomonadota bacterium]
MSRSAYPLKMPASVKTAAARLAKADGVSLNQFIAVAVAEKVGAMETAAEFLQRKSGNAKPADLMGYLRRAPKSDPSANDQPAAKATRRR